MLGCKVVGPFLGGRGGEVFAPDGNGGGEVVEGWGLGEVEGGGELEVLVSDSMCMR